VSGVDLDVSEKDSFNCSDMGAACPQGCETLEDKSWTRMSAFLGVSVQKDLDEQETLDNGYIQNAVILLAFKLDDAGMLEGKDGAAQKFIDKFIDSGDTRIQRRRGPQGFAEAARVRDQGELQAQRRNSGMTVGV
jgi:hypothetical protein